MSEVAALEVLQKKRTELENQWSSQLEKHRSLEGDIKALEEKVHAQLQEKIRNEDVALETLESKRKDLEKRLEELKEREHTESSQMPDELTMKSEETEQEAQEQSTEMKVEAAADDSNRWQGEDTKEKHKEEKKRKWM